MRSLALAVGLVWLFSGLAWAQTTPTFTIESREGGTFELDEGSEWRYTAVLSEQVSSETRVQYTISANPISGAGIEGTENDDFGSPISGVLTFAPNQTEVNFSVFLLVDILEEPDESYIVNLSAPAGGTGGPGIAACLTTERETPADGCAIGSIARSDAINIADFQVEIFISGGNTQRVTALGVAPGNTGSVTEGDVVTYTVTPVPNLAAASREIQIQATPAGGLGAAEYEIRNAAGAGLSTIPTANGGQRFALRLQRSGGARAQFQVAYLRDAIEDGGKRLILAAVSESSFTVADLVGRSTTITIGNGSPFNAPQLSLRAPDSPASEGGSAAFTVAVDRPTSGEIRVNYQVAASGLRPAQAADFGNGSNSQFPSGSISIGAGSDPSATIRIPIFNDALAELASETFSVTLSSPSGQNAALSQPPYGSASAEASIAPSDAPGITRNFSLSGPASATEGSAATYTVSFAGPAPSQNLSIAWSVTGGGGATFTSNPTSLSFAPADGADASKTFTVTSSQDTLSSAPRPFVVLLNNPTGGNAAHGDYAGDGGSANTTLNDDDEMRAYLSTNAVPVSEGGNADIGVRLAPEGATTGTADATTILYTVSYGSGSRADITLPTPAAATIAAGTGTLSGNIRIPVADDMLNEGAETITVTLSATSGAAAAIATASNTRPIAATITIAASDATSVSAFSAPPANSVFEGDNALFPVELSGGHPTANIVLAYSVEEGTGQAADHAAPGSFTITPAAAAAARAVGDPRPILLPILLAADGNTGEPTETLHISLASASGGGGGGISLAQSLTRHTITIPEDAPMPVLRIDPADPNRLPENQELSFRFPVTLVDPAPVSEGVTVQVNWAVLNPNTADLRPNSGTLSFAPGERRKFITLNIVEEIGTFTSSPDEFEGPEGVERFTVALSMPEPPSGENLVRILSSHASATGVIEANQGRKDIRNVIEPRFNLAATAVNEGSAVRVDIVFQSNTSVNAPYEDRTWRFCIPHSTRANTVATYNLGTLAAAADILVTDHPSAPGRITTSQGRCTGSRFDTATTHGTLVDFRIPRHSLLSNRNTTVPFLVQTIADASAEGPETIWITALDGLEDNGDVQFRPRVSAGGRTLDLSQFEIGSAQTGDVIAITINGNAAATRTLALSGPATAAESGAAQSYSVALSGGAFGAARTVNWEVTGSGANPAVAADFSGALTGSFSFPAGATSAQTFSIPAFNNDTLNEPQEEFTVRISMLGSDLNAETAIIGTASAVTTLTDNDPIMVSVADAAAAPEGGASMFTVSVTGGTRPGALRIGWSVGAAGGNAASVADFQSGRNTRFPSGAFSIPAGQPSGVLSVANFNDGIEESTAESFQLTITAAAATDLALEPEWPQGAITLTDATASGSIAPSDLTVTATLAEPAAVTEGAAGGAVFVLQTDNLLDADLQVTYTLSGTAERHTEYTHDSIRASDAESTTYTLTRTRAEDSSGATTRLVFALPQDDLNEGSETIIVTLTAVSIPGSPQAAALGTPITRTLTINDDDPIRASLLGNAADVAEGQSAGFTVELQGGGGYTGAVMVPWQVVATAATTDTDAVAGDFDANDDGAADTAYPSGVLSVPARGSAALNIKIFADSDAAEMAEKFAVRLFGTARMSGTAASGGGGGVIEAVNPTPLPNATILSAADAARVAVNLSGPSEVAEGSTTSAYTVTLSGGTAPVADIVVTVTVTTDGDADTPDASAADFSGGAIPSIGNLTFTSTNWQTAQTFTVQTAGDTSSEPTETFLVRIAATGNGTNGLSLGALERTTRIGDDDDLTISLGDVTAAEGAEGVLPITIAGGTPSTALQVQFAVQGGTAAAGDYTLPASPAEIAAAGDSAGALRIAIADDVANEASETLQIRLTGISSGGGGVAVLGGGSVEAAERNATLTITDNDPVIITASATPPLVQEEAGAAEFRITLSGGTRPVPVMLDWSAAGSATHGVDWIGATSGTRSFAPGAAGDEASVQIISFGIVDDALQELEDENIVLRVANLAGDLPGEFEFAVSEATATITPSDISFDPTLRIESPQCPPRGCPEGSYARFPVTLSNPPPVDVTVNWRIHRDSDRSTPDVTLHEIVSLGSSALQSDFSFDVIIRPGADQYLTGSIVFRADQQEQRKFIEIPLRSDSSVRDDAPQEFYEVRISATPDSGDNAVTVAVDRATSTIDGGINVLAEIWRIDQSFSTRDVSEGGTVRVTLTVSPNLSSGEARNVPGPSYIGARYRLCLFTDNAVSAPFRGSNPSVGAGDFRVAVGGAVKNVEQIAPRRAFPCTAVDVEVPFRVQGPAHAFHFDIEILDDGVAEGAEVLYVAGVGEFETARYGGLGFQVEVPFRFGEARNRDGEQRAIARMNLITIAPSQARAANTRTLSLSGATRAAEDGAALMFSVAPSAAFSSAATATWSIGGRGAAPVSALAGVDFSATSGALTFAAGSTAAQTFSITPVDDSLNEPEELFTLRVAMDDISAGTDPTSTEGTLEDNDGINIQIEDARPAPEGDSARFPIVLSGGQRSGPLLMAWRAEGSGAQPAEGADFVGGALPNGLFVIPAEGGDFALNIPIAVDQAADDGDQFSVAFSTPVTPGAADAGNWGAGVIRLQSSSASGMIAARQTFMREFGVTTSAADVDEGGNVIFTIAMSGMAPPAGTPATVQWRVAGDVEAADYSVTGDDTDGTLSFSAVGSQTLNFAITDDTLGETPEALTLMLHTPASGAGLAPGRSSATTVIAIDRNDVTRVTIARASTTPATVAESATVSFTISLSGSLRTAAVLVPVAIGLGADEYRVASSGAVAPTTGGALITFGIGGDPAPTATDSATLTLNLLDDDRNEGSEILRVTGAAPGPEGLRTASGLVEYASGGQSGTVTLTDDDPIAVRIDPVGERVFEGSFAEFTVSFTGASRSEGAITVAYTASGITGTPGDANNGSLVIPALAASGAIRLEIPTSETLGDGASETLRVTLNSAGAGSGGGEASVAPAPGNSAALAVQYQTRRHRFEFGSSEISAVEGETLMIPVFRRGPAPSPGTSFIISYDIQPGATSPVSPEDFPDEGGDGIRTAITLPVATQHGGFILNFLTRTDVDFISIQIADDALAEGEETFSLGLGFPPRNSGASEVDGGVTLGGRIQVTILASDQPVTLSVAGPAGNLREGTPANFRVSFAEMVETTEAVTLAWTITFPAAAPGVNPATAEDFPPMSLSGTASIPAGQRSVDIPVTARDDGLESEMAKSFILTLSNPAGGGPIAAPVLHATPMVTATIGSSARHFLSLSGPASANEGANAVMLRYSAALEGDAYSADTTVTWTLTHITTSNADIDGARSGTLVFDTTDGDGTSKDFTITLAADSLNEATESYSVQLSVADASLDGGTAIDTPVVTTIADSIEDTILVTIARATAASVGEGATASFSVTLSGGLRAADVVVPFELSGIDDSEFNITTPGGLAQSASGGVVTFDTGGMPTATDGMTIIVNLLDDALNEASKTLTITGARPGAAGLRATGGGEIRYATGGASAVVAVADDDAITLSIARAANTPAMVPESSRVVFDVALDGASAGSAAAITVSYTAEGLTGTPGDPGGGSLTIPAGQATGVIRLLLPHSDSLGAMDPDETLTVTLGNTASIRVGSGGGAVATSDSSDSASVVVDYRDARYIITLDDPPLFVEEGEEITFVLRLGGPNPTGEENISLNWNYTPVTATSADIPTAASSTRAFRSGDRTQSFPLTIGQDDLSEPAETFRLSFGRHFQTVATGGLSLPPAITITIAESDRPVTLSLAGTGRSFREGITENFSVSFPEMVATTTPVMVDWAITFPATPGTTAATAAEFASHMALSGIATIPAGQRSVDIPVTAREDGLDMEAAKSFTMTISNPRGGGEIAALSLANTPEAVAATLAPSAAHFLTVTGPSSITEGTATVESGTYTITLEGRAYAASTTVTWTLSHGGTSDDDFVAASDRSGTVTFATTDGDGATKTFTLTVDEDDLNEAAEFFSLQVSVADPSIDGRTDYGREAITTITDSADDAIAVTIARASSTQASVGEAATASFSVTLSGGLRSADVVVPFRVRGLDEGEFDITAPSGIAASATGAAITFDTTGTPTATDSATITVNLLDDALNEASETLSVIGERPGVTGLRTVGSIAYATGGASAMVTVTDDDAISVSLAADDASVNEGRDAGFTVTLSGESAAAVSVAYSLSSIRLTPTDANNGSISIPAGQTTGAFRIRIPFSRVLDSMTPPDTLTVSLGDITPGAAGGVVTAAGSPNNSDSVTVNYVDAAHTISFSSPPTSIVEGAVATFTVNRFGPAIASGNTIEISWTYRANSGAGNTDASDFAGGAPAGGSVIFRGSEADQTFTITTQEDTTSEPDEAFVLELTATAAVLASNDGVELPASPISVRIGESDRPILVSIAAPGSDLVEGTAANFRVSFTGSITTTAPVLVGWQIVPVTARPTEFASNFGNVSIPAGDDEVNLAITASADNLNEAAERFLVVLNTPRGGGAIAAPMLTSASRATGNIAASDPATVNIVLTGGETSVREGRAAMFRVSFSGASASGGDVTLGWSAAMLSQTNTGTGDRAPNTGAAHEFSSANGVVPSSDGLTARGTVTIPAGQSNVVFRITPAQDGREEDDETIRVTLTSPQVGRGGGMVSSSPDAAQVTVPANLASVRDFEVARTSPASVSEGALVAFRVSLVGEAPVTDATVDWSVGGVAASDWSSASPRTLRFTTANWQTPQNISIAIAQDGLNEAAETLALTLSNAAGGGGGGTAISSGDAMVEIAASDPITYAIASADRSVVEGDSGNTAVTFAVALSGAAGGSAGGAVQIPFAAGTGTASASDYTLSNSPLSFATATGSQNITVMVVGDVLSEANETLSIELGAPSTGAEGGAFTPGRARVVLTITDDDELSVRIARRSGESGDISEAGGVARFAVTVTGGTPTADIVLPFSVGGAVSPADYDISAPAGIAASAAGGTLTLTAPGLSGEIAVSASEDQLLEAREAFAVQLGALSGGGGSLVIAPGGGSAGTGITDNDPVSVAIARMGSGPVAEGGAVQFRLTLTGGQLSADARIPYTASGVEAGDLSGGTAAGLTGLSGAVVVAASSSTSRTTTADFTLNIVADNLNEAAETLQVALGAPSSVGSITAAAAPDNAAMAEIPASDPLTLALAAPDPARVREAAVAAFDVALNGASAGSEGVLILSYTIAVGNSQNAAAGVEANSADNPDILLLGPGGSGEGSSGATGMGSGTLTIPAQTTSAQIRMRVRFDNLDEGETPENLLVRITGVVPDSSRPGAGMAGISTTANSAQIELENVNAARSLAVTSPPEVAEGGVITFSVGLEGAPPLTPFVVEWTLEPAGVSSPTAASQTGLARNHGVAHPDDPDFNGALSGTLSFAVGSLAPQVVRVQTRQDPLNEGDEALGLRLTPPSTDVGGRPEGFPEEAPATQVSVPVSRTVIPANDPVVLSLVRPVDDPDTLSAVDDFGFAVSFGVDAVTGEAIVPTTQVTIPFTYMVGSQSFTGEVRAAAGQTAQELNRARNGAPVMPPAAAVAAIRAVTGTQDISVVLGNPAAATPSAAPAGVSQPQPMAMLRSGQTLAEMRTAPVRVEKQLGELRLALDLKRAEAPEGTTLTLVATLRGSGTLAGALSIPWSVSLAAPAYALGGAAAQAVDFESGVPSGSLSFGSGEGGDPGSSREIQIAIAEDDLEELGGEYFQLALSPASGPDAGRVALDVTPTAVLIPALRATLNMSNATAPEGTDAVFMLALSDFAGGDATTRDVVVSYVLEDGTACGAVAADCVGGADYLAPPGTLTIPAGEDLSEIRVPLVLDGELESQEQFTLRLTDASGGGGNIIFPEMASDLAAVGTITDDADQERRRAQRVGTLVAVLSRSTAVLASDAISARLDRSLQVTAAESAQLSIANRKLIGAGGAGAANGAGGAGAGDDSPRGPVDLGLALFGTAGQGGASPGAAGAGAGAVGRAGGAAAVGGGAFGGLGAGLSGGANMWQGTALPSLAALLEGSSFSFGASWQDFSKLVEGVEIWGSGGFSDLSGSPQQGVSRLDYKGDNLAFFLGADRPVRGNLLAGVALGYASGELDFTDRAGSFTLSGNLSSNSIGLYPYLGWQIAPQFTARLVLGLGRGSVDMEEIESADVRRTLPGDLNSTMLSVAAGFSGRVQLAERTELKLGFEFTRVQSWVGSGRFTDGARLPNVSAHSLRVGGEAEVGRHFALPGGLGLRPFVSARWRLDSGDAVEHGDEGRSGLRSFDMGGGAEADWPEMGLVLQLRGEAQLSDTGHEEHHFSVDLDYDLGADGLGLALSLNSAMSARRSAFQSFGASALLSGGGAGGNALGGLGGASTARSASSLSGEIAYGMALRAFGGGALLTPYAQFDLAGSARRYETGLRLLRGSGLSLGLGLRMDLGADSQGEGAARELLLHGKLRF